MQQIQQTPEKTENFGMFHIASDAIMFGEKTNIQLPQIVKRLCVSFKHVLMIAFLI